MPQGNNTSIVRSGDLISHFGDGRDPRLDPYPDENYIGYLIRQGRFEFARRDMRDWIRETVYWQEQEIPHPEHVEFEPVHTGVVTESVQRLMGIYGDRPWAGVTETSVESLRIKRAQNVQDFLNTLFPALEVDARRDTWDLVMEDVLRMGRGYDKLEYVPIRHSLKNPFYPRLGEMLDAEIGPDGKYNYSPLKETNAEYLLRKKEYEMFGRLPLMWRHMPARGCYAWYDDEGIAEFIHVEERRIRDVARRYPNSNILAQMARAGQSSVSHVIWAEYWNRSYYAYWISQGYANQTYDERTWQGTSLLNRIMTAEIAERGPNIYGIVPVIETPGLISTSRDPARMHLSAVDFMIPIATYLDQLTSQHGSAVRMWAWPTAVLKNLGINGTVLAQSPINPDGRPIPIDIEPGKMLTLLPGEEISWLAVPENQANALELIEYIQKRADALGLSSAVFDAAALQSNGYLYNSVVNALRSKFSQIPRHVKRSHIDRCNLAMRIVEIHGEPLFVRKPGDGDEEIGAWFKLGLDDIKGHHYSIDVKYEDTMPTDEASNLGMAVQATTPIGGGDALMSKQQARGKYLGDKDPLRTKQLILQERYEETIGAQFLMVKAAKDAGTLLDQNEMMDPYEVEGIELPPGLQQALGMQSAGGSGNNGGGSPAGPIAAMGGGAGGASLGAPTAMAGVAGAPATPVLPGLGRSITPPPPQPSGGGIKPPIGGNKGRSGGGRSSRGGAKRPSGRAAGQSRRPPRQKPAGGV